MSTLSPEALFTLDGISKAPNTPRAPGTRTSSPGTATRRRKT
ncbi:hypothetical protein ACFWZY_29230 [Streptomyces sp. NPDC058992]